ncbi:hypothetical protein LLQ46_10245 [Rouxiella badensis]|uniref:hypothetical protein n=1 Tax=Rouxiella badensis TaxID=1646377 RepID=UPI0013EF419F|nr:hypothetical protein [Rouxiella badensis]MCC3747226.1 hypothetical protein [Rouxiella badensis]QII38603.1 hypothetical protein G3M83_13435 [Rouxiella badensis]
MNDTQILELSAIAYLHLTNLDIDHPWDPLSNDEQSDALKNALEIELRPLEGELSPPSHTSALYVDQEGYCRWYHELNSNDGTNIPSNVRRVIARIAADVGKHYR